MKRIKFEGRVLSTFDIAYILDMSHYRSLPWISMYDIFKYEEMVYFFNEFLNSKYYLLVCLFSPASVFDAEVRRRRTTCGAVQHKSPSDVVPRCTQC